MIEQLHYAATPRYRFSQPLGKLELPERLTELSVSSMHDLKGKLFQPYNAEFIEPFLEKTACDEAVNLNGKAFSTLLTPLRPVQDGTPVVAIDVSHVKIGETEKGIVCAVRGAITWNEERQYRYLRLGPFPFHLTEENKRVILSGLSERSSVGFSPGVSTLAEAQSQLGNFTERWIQLSISCSADDSIILWDGSMTAGTSGNPAGAVSEILGAARRNSSSVLAFSKTTTMRFLGWKVTDLVREHKPPCLFEIEDLPLSISKTHLLGRIYLAKLAAGACSFRLDIDRNLAREQGISAVEKLLGNEIVFQGYPETLRLAHIYSTFTASDIVGIQSFIARECGLRMVTHHSIRKALFGPYGTGFED